ncbi:MAG: 2-oxoisovalerate dehydrogenase [Gemmatimonadetes bacterium]|nr:2-oxoisovalerate dehydrogenase [Gemmatimonadota bacterium]
MTELVFLVEEAPEGGYTARGLGAPVFTEADTLEELREAVRDAVRCHFDPGTEPKLVRLHLVREEVLTP